MPTQIQKKPRNQTSLHRDKIRDLLRVMEICDFPEFWRLKISRNRYAPARKLIPGPFYTL